jgi:hypothetical protein
VKPLIPSDVEEECGADSETETVGVYTISGKRIRASVNTSM